MKLFELISFTPRQTKTTAGEYAKRLRAGSKAKYAGSGSLGAAFDIESGKRLGQITKLGKAAKSDLVKAVPVENVSEDGYLSYLSAVYDREQKGHGNPYFPVIHDLDIMRGPDKKLHYNIKLEKLVPFYSAKLVGNLDLMASLYEHMFGELEREDYRTGEAVANVILVVLNHAFSVPSTVKDPDLLDSIKLVNSVIKTNSDFRLDLHSNNVMWRITGTMPQLVILDPIV